jgi:DNA-binding response OmpR family regulator
MITRILLAEDDANLGTLLRDFLKAKGFEVTLCTQGEEAINAFRSGVFELCLLDVMMPRKDGFTLGREIRALHSTIPILYLTARNSIADKSEGFGLGGDDYLTKPFNMEELLLRMRALLRRSQGTPESPSAEATHFQLGGFTFDHTSRSLARNGTVQRLTTREADLLRLLCLHRNQVLRRETALKLIWGDDSYYNARSMDVFITRLRKFLKEDPSIQILNIHGSGYRLLAEGSSTV